MTTATKILAQLETGRYWTAATISLRTGIDRKETGRILDEFVADGLAVSRSHDAFRLTYKLAA